MARRLHILFLLVAIGIPSMESKTQEDKFSGLEKVHPNSILTSNPTYRLLKPSYKISRNKAASPLLERGRCNTDYNFEYLMLTLMWGPGFCATSGHKCIRPALSFSIHGMWPQLTSGEKQGFCCFDNTFYYDELKPLLADLNQLWFSYYDQDSRSFWSHEWLKHGTCMRDVESLQGEQLFFSTTLKTMKSLPLLETLQKDDIIPGTGPLGKSYNTSAIIQSLKSITANKNVMIDCDLEHHQPIPVLTGLNLCFDKGLKFIDCPASKTRCQGEVYFRS